LPSNPQNLPLFDAKRLLPGLEKQDVSDLLDLFLRTAEQDLAALENGAARINQGEKPFLQALHAFKGACVTVGASRLTESAKSLECDMAEGAVIDLNARIADIQQLLKATAYAMRLYQAEAP